MHKLYFVFLVGLLTAGCAAQSSAPPPTPTRAKSGTIRFDHILNVDIRYVPILIALDDLQTQGYTVTRTQLNSSPLIVAALTRGDADIGSLDPQTMWTAIAKGADARSFMLGLASPQFLVAKSAVKSCGDLDGGRVGVFSTSGLIPTMFNEYIKRNCPNAKFDQLLISDNSGRIAALVGGQVDAVELSWDSALDLERREPGKFSRPVEFTKEFPNLVLSVLNVRSTWAKQNPEILKDFIKALLNAQRRVQANPQLLYDEAVKRFGTDPAVAKASGDGWLKVAGWDPNGGLNRDNLQYTMDFIKGTNAIPSNLKIDDVSDLTYLNAVLDQIGRQ